MIGQLDYSPIIISLKTGVVATVMAFFLGTVIAWRVGQMKGKMKSVIDCILTLPLVLPPTVAGFFLLLLFSTNRPFGAFLYDSFHIKVIQTYIGCVIAAFVISFPLMYRNARAAFDLVDKNTIYAARTLGMSEFTIFRRVIMPAARPGILSGSVLTFTRSIGEYGATSMLAGNIPGKTSTISQKIAMVIMDNDYVTAGFYVAIIVIISFFAIYFINTSAAEKNSEM